MSNRRDFHTNHHHDNGIKYSEIAGMDQLADYKNGTFGDQNQNSIDGRSDSVCPLTTTVLLTDRGVPKTNAMDRYRSSDALDYKVSSRVTADRYKKKAIIFGLIAGIMTVATIVLAILLGVGVGITTEAPVGDTTTTASEQEVCTSTACVTAASRILNSMNLSADPCKDFFTYSCGKWNIDHVIPQDKPSVSTFNSIIDSVSLILKRVLEMDSSGDRDAIKKAKIHYNSCMDTEKINSLTGKPALDMIQKLGGMPLFGDPIDSFGLEEALARSLSEFGSFAVISMRVSSDAKNSSVNIIQVDEPSLGMPNRDYYLDEKRRNKTLLGYSQYMRDYLGKLWKEKNATAFDEKAVTEVSEQIIRLETELASSMMKPEDKRNTSAIYRKRTIQQMTDDITQTFDWETYINTAFNIVGKTVAATDEIVSNGDRYFQNLTAILSKYDNSLIQNYIVWMVLRLRIPYLEKGYRDTQAPYMLATSGVITEGPRWQTCSHITNTNFIMSVGALFVQAAFPEENKQVTETMVENIRKSFIALLPENEWMDEETKVESKNKANMIKALIGYPNYILDEEDSKLDDDIAEANVDAGTFFQNMQNMAVYSTKKNMRKLGVPFDREEWVTAPANVNAFYSPRRNQIVFPAAILQPPFYDPGQPNSMNYGGIGMVIGHEITHGFDDTGSQYNELGNLENWWTNNSRRNFEEKAECMVQQYSNYYWDVAKSNLNGKLTLGENIADNGGIREAFYAYQTWKSENDADLLLPGLQDFTQEQLFFLSMAQVWCGTFTPEYAALRIATDGHSPGIYRVIGSLSNFEEFGKAYNCKLGDDEMYPNEEDTCRVW